MGMGNDGTGCFTRGTGVSMGRVPSEQCIHHRTSCMAVHGQCCWQALLGTTTSVSKSALFDMISSFLHFACSHSVSDIQSHKGQRHSVDNGPHSRGKGQQLVISDLACNIWCRNAVWLGDSDDLCSGVSGVCCGCWGALFWQCGAICCWSLPLFYGLRRSAFSVLPLRPLQYCLTAASPLQAKKTFDQHLHYDFVLSNLALYNSYMH